MDYQKLDGQLATECENAGPGDKKSLSVFVRVRGPLHGSAVDELAALGAPEPDRDKTILTMELSPKQVADLSDRPWVVSIRSSRKLRPLE